MSSQDLEPDPRAANGRPSNSKVQPSNSNLQQSGGSEKTHACSCHQHAAEQQQDAPPPSDPPPLLLKGARTEPSALLKVQGSVQRAGGGAVDVQPMVDSGASGMGFVDPAFVAKCGVQLRPSTRRITLADGSEVRAAGEATLSYTLQARSCRGKENTPPVHFTSTFIATPLAPYELILGMGWLEQHHARVGFRERSIQLRVDGAGKERCIRPLARCADGGGEAAEAAPLQLKAISRKAVYKLARKGQAEEMFLVRFRAVDEGGKREPPATGAHQEEKPPLGSEHPRVAALLEKYRRTAPFGELSS